MKDQGFRNVIESLHDAVVVVNRAGGVCFANAAARTLLNCGGPPPDKPFGPSPRAGTSEACFLEGHGHPSTRRITVAATEWEGEPAWVATFQDISQEERTRQEVETFLTHSPALMYVRDAEGRYTLANRRFAGSVNRPFWQFRGSADAAIFPPALSQLFAENHRLIVETGESVTFEVMLPEGDGDHAYLCHEFPLCDTRGNVYAVAGIRTDITERNQTEESLRKSEARRRAILESSVDCVVMTDADDRILEFNLAAEQTFGYTRSEALGQSMTELLIAPAVRESFRAGLKRCLTTGSRRLFDRRVEITAIRKGQTEFPIEAAISVARHEEQPIFTAVLHDITQRCQAHQKLVQQTEVLQDALDTLERVRERERQVLAAVPSIFIGVDDDRNVTHWNPSAERQFGLSAGEVIGKPLVELAIGWPSERIAEAISRCSDSGGPVRLEELRASDAADRERILNLTINRIDSRSNEGSGVVVVGADITARKAMEAQLILAQKMESIGQLAAGIAHEINTPTQYVSDNTRFLRDAFNDFKQVLARYESLRDLAKQGPVPPAALEQLETFLADLDLPFLTEEIPRAIEQSMEGLHRVAEIVRAMKQFSHPDQDEMELADLNNAIRNTVLVARNEWKYVAEMELDLEPDLPAVPCLLGRFNQVILNLIVNAAQAIGDVLGQSPETKGKILITTRKSREAVEIRVKDTGTGIPLKIRNRVFDPFFTTKQVGKGTGQGLAIAHNIIVEKHGGTITFESEDGAGTTFILRLSLKADECTGVDQV